MNREQQNPEQNERNPMKAAGQQQQGNDQNRKPQQQAGSKDDKQGQKSERPSRSDDM